MLQVSSSQGLGWFVGFFGWDWGDASGTYSGGGVEGFSA